MGENNLSPKIRYAKYAGSFYAGSKNSLIRQIEECFTHRFGPGRVPTVAEKGPRNIIGLICPHAGYMYSGPVAANSYYHLALDGKVEVFVILGPNHQGVGSGVAVMDQGVWRTPLGDVEVDSELAREILRQSDIIDVDDLAHTYEHSIEVQLPFLQYIYGLAGLSFKFVPICFLMQDLETGREVGRAVARALQNRNAVIIASTDWTHYEPHKQAYEKDMEAIKAVIQLNEDLFYSILESRNVTACGYSPVVALISAAKEIGAKRAEILSYKTSGDITGDKSAVVGYASIMISR
ncbi:MAG: AmmeMemoRadiSam system protein B [Candidatus Bathyarchaeota archaeon]|nr:AmmeMemoRadiSam system protein B [Candidatus Bathyarchaeota archaeon]